MLMRLVAQAFLYTNNDFDREVMDMVKSQTKIIQKNNPNLSDRTVITTVLSDLSANSGTSRLHNLYTALPESTSDEVYKLIEHEVNTKPYFDRSNASLNFKIYKGRNWKYFTE